MYRIFISCLLVILFSSSRANDSVTVDFGPLATIDMPGTPEDTVMNGQVYYKYGDSLEAYRYYSGPCGFYDKKGTLNKFYSDYTLKVLDVQNGQLLAHRDIDIDGITAREIDYTTSKDNKNEHRKMRLVFVNGTLYCFSHSYLVGHTELASHCDEYFNSFKLKQTYGLNQMGQKVKFPTYFLYAYFGFLFLLVVVPRILVLCIVLFRKKIF